MVNAIFKAVLLFVLLLTVSACGGGGGGSAETPPAAGTIISGVASKGIIAGGTIKIYAINSNGSRRLLVTTTTNSDGTYKADIGTFSGTVLVEASGDYVDEATGDKKTVTADVPLRAALPSVSGSVSMAVTPLTELAVVKAGPTTLTAASITSANALISEIFKVDIVNTMPVAATSEAMNGGSSTQKDYTIALAAVSQMMAGGTSLASVVEGLNSSISSSGMTTTAAQNFQQSISDFVVNPKNNTGIDNVNQTNLASVGGQTASYLLASSSSQASASILGIQMTIELPAGVSCRKDVNGTILSSSLYLSGVAPQTSMNAARCTPATTTTLATVDFAIINTAGFGIGEFATVALDIEPEMEKPAATGIRITKFVTITDVSGALNSGITAVISSLP